MDWLARAATRRPDAPAVIRGGEVVTYGELDDLADRVAAMLIRSGPDLRGRVAYWGETTIRSVVATWGIPRAGSWAVPISTRIGAAPAMSQTREAGVRGLWALTADSDLTGLPPAAQPPPGWGPPDPASRYVVFTSGTQGRARGILLTGGNVAAAVGASRDRLGNGPDDAWLCVLPIAHVGGLSILWRCAEAGAPLVLEERFEADGVADLLAGGRIAYASLVPTMLRRVLDAHPGPYRVAGGVLVGGGPADRALLERALEAGLPVLATYGSTETCSQIATVAPGEARESMGTVGRPLEGFDVRIVDSEGADLAPGETGRIRVSSPAMSPGPLGGEGENERGVTMPDLGRFDEEGRLVVLGRADEVIVTGGLNVHPDEVESVLVVHPDFDDVAVFGEPDPDWGAVVTAEVVPAPGARFDEAAAVAWARSRLAGHQVPKRWRVVEVIERTELGKRPRPGAPQ